MQVTQIPHRNSDLIRWSVDGDMMIISVKRVWSMTSSEFLRQRLRVGDLVTGKVEQVILKLSVSVL